ncbi:hypothetical protein [Photobacterium sp. 1_MG-2023]|uniref:hypothetical protein n=1 Tax=Photobacterium sp. 1_MG-2023 TaxID=3062646 RepID=UPI0026E2511F|nr:hypothetical protein [Photobacterium sp. 1_MG-2023]MDO6708385.1 hypothetical protein [Photobacterium sp. 1_MG-2023]
MKEKEIVVLDLGLEGASKQACAMLDNHYTLYEKSISAENEAEALSIYQRESVKNLPLNHLDLLCFQSNRLRRLRYFFYSSLISFPLLYMVETYNSYSSGFHLFAIILFFYINMAVNIARWKNIGHPWGVFFIAFVASILINFLTLGLASLFLGIYLMAAKEHSVQHAFPSK